MYKAGVTMTDLFLGTYIVRLVDSGSPSTVGLPEMI